MKNILGVTLLLTSSVFAEQLMIIYHATHNLRKALQSIFM
jgi:hypothetical protein